MTPSLPLFPVFSTDRQDMEWALNAMRQNENGFGGIPNLSDDMGIVKLRGLPFGCSKEEIIQFFNGMYIYFRKYLCCIDKSVLFAIFKISVTILL